MTFKEFPARVLDQVVLVTKALSSLLFTLSPETLSQTTSINIHNINLVILVATNNLVVVAFCFPLRCFYIFISRVKPKEQNGASQSLGRDFFCEL